MKRLIEAMDTLKFWAAVFVLSVLFVFAYAFVVNRDAVSRNAEVINRQQQQLVELCETIRVFDTVIVQQRVIVAQTMGRDDLPEWALLFLQRNSDLFGTAHFELSGLQVCRQIE